MFFPSHKSDANTGPANKPSRNGKETSPQKAVSRSAQSKPPANNSLTSTSTNPVGSLTAILSARSGGDDNIPTADSEQLVARLFKGLGVPMYQPRIPIAYKKEPVPPALKNYRWSAFDLTISHDTMLTIAKPPPPPQSFVHESPSPPVEEVGEEPRLLISNLPTFELESPPIGPPEIEPIAQLVERSVKLERLASQKMRSSVKVAPLNKKASAKLLTEFNDWKAAHSTKQANANVAFSIKMQSVKVSKGPDEVPSEEDAELGNFDQPEIKAAVKVERKRSMIPSSILEDVESEQLIDGLLDMSLNATAEAAGPDIDANTVVNIEPFAPADVDATPADTKLPTEDSSVAVISTETTVNAEIEPPEEIKAVPAEEAPVEVPLDSRLASVKITPVIPPQPSKSVKSPNSTSFFSSLLNSISSKVPGFGGDGKVSDEEEEEEDVVPIEQSSFSTKKKDSAGDMDEPTEGAVTGVSERKTGVTQSVKEVPLETHFDFYAEAAKLAVDAATDTNASEQVARQSNGRAPPAVSFTIDGANSSKQGKPAAHVGAIISPAERSVFKPTFAMPRPSQQEQDPLAAQLVRELQQQGGVKQLPLQTGPQSVEGPTAPLSGPKNKKRKDNFSILEDLFLDGQPSPPPPKAAKYAVDLQNSDSEGEASAAYNQGKNKKAKKTPKPQKKVSPAKAQQWYLAGAYSSHHEAIDALNRMHKLLAGAAADPNDPSLDLDNKFRLQRDLSRMQWVVECCDAQHKAMILSHATRSPVVPEKDKSKFRNIVGVIKEDTPAYQGAGAGIYHSPPQAHHPNGSEHKHHEEHFLRERDAFYENNMRMVKANLSPHESPPPKQPARRQGPQSKQHSPPPRGSGATAEKQGAKSAPKEGNGSRFPAIPQAQIPKQTQGQRRGKDAK